jgi:methylglyoxal reductase
MEDGIDNPQLGRRSQAAAEIGSGVGLGTFPFSNVFSSLDQREAERIVSKFTALGGKYIETAPVYEVNRVSLARIISKYRRDKLFIATKCVTGFRDGTRVRSGQPEWLRYQVEQELSRLSIKQLDLLQAHIVPDDCSVESLVETLDSLKKAGKTRYIGLSNVDTDTLSRALQVAQVDFVQNRFSYLHRSPHRGVDDLCHQAGIVLNPYQSIERGQLASRLRPSPSRKPDDIRNAKHEYVGEPFSVVRAWVEELLLPIARTCSVDLETLMIAWVRAQRGIVMPVVGFTSSKQVKPVLAGGGMSLKPETLASLEASYMEMNRRTREQFGLNLDEYRGLK